jgi:hypothetical protein
MADAECRSSEKGNGDCCKQEVSSVSVCLGLGFHRPPSSRRVGGGWQAGREDAEEGLGIYRIWTAIVH